MRRPKEVSEVGNESGCDDAAPLDQRWISASSLVSSSASLAGVEGAVSFGRPVDFEVDAPASLTNTCRIQMQ